MITPRVVPVVSVTGVVGLVLCALLAGWVRESFEADQRRDCERAVSVRDDGRAMWLYLVDTNTSADPKRVAAFVAELNERLPRLKCVDGNTVPVTAD